MPDNVRILYIISSIGLGGAERQMIELIKGLQHSEMFTIRVVVLEAGFFYKEMALLAVKIHTIERRLKKDPGVVQKLFKICSEFRPDIIHSWESMASIYSIPVAKLLKIKLVNGDIRNAPDKIEPFGKVWLRAGIAFPFSDVIVANSHAGLKAYNVRRDKGVCIHNGFDLLRLQGLRHPEEIRREQHIATRKVVGMVARFSEKKDYKSFFEAALKVIDLRDDVSFLAVGSGKTLDCYKRRYEKRGRGQILFVGEHKKVEEIINIFDIGVLLTNQKIHGEGISNALMEYMALGKPVVANHGGGTNEIVVDSLNGFIVPPFAIGRVVEKLLVLLDDSALCKRMGGKGRQIMTEKFLLGHMIDRYSKLYRDLTT